MTRQGNVARVLLDTPLPQLDHIFEYQIPQEFLDVDLQGYLVKVPLRSGKRYAQGYVIETSETSEYTGKLSPIESLISTQPILLNSSYELAKSVSTRQAGTTSDVLRHIIPRRYVRTEKSFTPSVQPVLAAKSTYDQFLTPGSRATVQIPPGARVMNMPVWIDSFCREALHNLESQKSTIISVPDFRDITAVYEHLTSLVPEEFILRTDTKQEDKFRYENYLRAITDTPHVIIGNRSSVLFPAHNLGSLLVWNESDPLMTEPTAPYHQARDVALIRQKLENCSLLFASYTRSVATQRLVEIGWLNELSLPTTSTPNVMFTNDEDNGFSSRIPSRVWQEIKDSVAQGPVLVQVAHRGYSTALACSSCKERALCTLCQGLLALDKNRDYLQCRRCRHIETNWTCPHCQATTIKFLNSGSTKTAEELGKAFPGTRVVISDGEHLVTDVVDKSVIVVATAGAEPFTPHGYRAVVLLDGLTHRLRDIPMAEEEYLSKSAHAISLAQTDATVYVVGSGQELGKVLSLGLYREWALKQFESCAELKIPPAVRSASLTGTPSSVHKAISDLAQWNVKVFGPHPGDDHSHKAIIFFDYKNGEKIAATLKAAIIETSTKRTKTRDSLYTRSVELRVKMDDTSLSLL